MVLLPRLAELDALCVMDSFVIDDERRVVGLELFRLLKVRRRVVIPLEGLVGKGPSEVGVS